jgi:hypothetical protein
MKKFSRIFESINSDEIRDIFQEFEDDEWVIKIEPHLTIVEIRGYKRGPIKLSIFIKEINSACNRMGSIGYEMINEQTSMRIEVSFSSFHFKYRLSGTELSKDEIKDYNDFEKYIEHQLHLNIEGYEYNRVATILDADLYGNDKHDGIYISFDTYQDSPTQNTGHIYYGGDWKELILRYPDDKEFLEKVISSKGKQYDLTKETIEVIEGILKVVRK